MKRFASSVLVAVLLVGMMGCSTSNVLSRKVAQSKIDEMVKVKMSSPPTKEITLHTGSMVSAYCVDTSPGEYDATSGVEYGALIELGLLVKSPTPIPHVWNVEFTDAGKRLESSLGGAYGHDQKSNCDEWQWSLPVAKFERIEVTGIRQEGIHAKVDIALKLKLTPLGLSLKTLPVNYQEAGGKDFASAPKDAVYLDIPDVVPFDKYDDGWRIVESRN